MKFISAMVLTLGIGAALMSTTTTTTPPVVGNQDKKDNTNNQVSQIAKVQPIQTQEFNGAIRVIAPLKDLESAIRASEKGDILILGPEGWYRLESKAFQQGTKVYVLSTPGSLASMFPKETDFVR